MSRTHFQAQGQRDGSRDNQEDGPVQQTMGSHPARHCVSLIRPGPAAPSKAPSRCCRAQPGSAVTLAPSPAPAPAPLCSVLASSARLPSSCRLRARARAPRGGGKLASVVTITNSIVLSRAPANKVIHYGGFSRPPWAARQSAGHGLPPLGPRHAPAPLPAGASPRRSGRHAAPRGPAAAAPAGAAADRRLVFSRNVN